MAQILIALQEADRQAASRLVVTLLGLGFDPPDVLRAAQLEHEEPTEAKSACRAGIVVWSAQSSRNPKMFELARQLLADGKLLLASVDAAPIPAAFTRQGANTIALGPLEDANEDSGRILAGILINRLGVSLTGQRRPGTGRPRSRPRVETSLPQRSALPRRSALGVDGVTSKRSLGPLALSAFLLTLCAAAAFEFVTSSHVVWLTLAYSPSQPSPREAGGETPATAEAH